MSPHLNLGHLTDIARLNARVFAFDAGLHETCVEEDDEGRGTDQPEERAKRRAEE